MVIRKTGPLIAVIVAAGIGLAGCGSSDDDGAGAASTGTAGGGGAAGGTDAQQAVKYAQCMRSNGVGSFPDPVNGKFQLKVEKGGPLDPTNPQFQAAQKACKSLEPPGLASGSGQNTQQQEQMLKFVDCMRKNGVKNFPDPQNGRFLIGGDVDSNSPQFKSAMQTCRKLLPGGVTAGGQ